MSRIDNLLVQGLDDVSGTGVVIIDESSGDEVFIPADKVEKVFEAMAYFVRITVPGHPTRHLTIREAIAADNPCQACGARPGEPCTQPTGEDGARCPVAWTHLVRSP